MDITYKKNDFQFILRTSILIFNKEKNKILLFRVKNRDFYMLIGGKVKELETSVEAIKREIEEEINLKINNIEFVCLSEEFVNDNLYHNHQINIIYKGIYLDKIYKNILEVKEENWCYYEWIDINNIDKYEIYPRNILELIQQNQKYHNIENILNKK